MHTIPLFASVLQTFSNTPRPPLKKWGKDSRSSPQDLLYKYIDVIKILNDRIGVKLFLTQAQACGYPFFYLLFRLWCFEF